MLDSCVGYKYLFITLDILTRFESILTRSFLNFISTIIFGVNFECSTLMKNFLSVVTKQGRVITEGDVNLYIIKIY